MKTVKAREQYGADSLDLTLPTVHCRDFNINQGDIFKVTIENKEPLEIKYTRVYGLEDQ